MESLNNKDYWESAGPAHSRRFPEPWFKGSYPTISGVLSLLCATRVICSNRRIRLFAVYLKIALFQLLVIHT